MAERVGDAAAGGAATEGAGGKRGNRGKSNWGVHVCHPGWVEIAWADARQDVPGGPQRVEFAIDRRSRAIHADQCRAICGAGEGMRVMEVQAPGLLTTVQDLG